jgi:hypothetical protein
LRNSVDFRGLLDPSGLWDRGHDIDGMVELSADTAFAQRIDPGSEASRGRRRFEKQSN